MEAGMLSEQVYWVFTVTVDQMDKFTPLIPKLVAATEKEPGALQLECNVGDDQKTVDFFERYTDSKAALFHQRESFAPSSKEFFALAKLTRWVIYGTPLRAPYQAETPLTAAGLPSKPSAAES